MNQCDHLAETGGRSPKIGGGRTFHASVPPIFREVVLVIGCVAKYELGLSRPILKNLGITFLN